MDSALARDGQPWFVPDFGIDWLWAPALAVRVSRLGKCVGLKFASRYYDAMTLLFVPRCADPRWSAGWDTCMDGAAVVGQWVATADCPTVGTTPTDVTMARFDAMVEQASRVMTLRTGDVLALPLDRIMPPQQATPNTRVQLELNGTRVLGFNIK